MLMPKSATTALPNRMGGDGSVIDLLEKRVGVASLRPERAALEELWLVSMAYFRGKQRFYYNDGRFMDATLEFSPDDVGYVVNKLRGRGMYAAAKLLSMNAKFQAKPTSGRVEDRERAKLSDRVFDHVRNTADFKYTQLMSTLWKVVCGTSYVKVWWDPLLGEMNRYYSVDGRSGKIIPEVMLSPEERQAKDAIGHFEDFPTGDIATSVLSPFSAYYDSASRDAGMMGCHWFAERHWVDIDRIAERWEMDEKDIQPMEGDAGLRNYEEAIAFMSKGTGLLPTFFATPEDKRQKRTLYIEMWERPSRSYRRGRRIVYAGGRILNEGRMGGMDNPYAGDRSGWAHLPYAKDDYMPNPGAFTASGMVEDALASQFYLNMTRSQMMRFMLTLGLPNTYVGDQSGLDTETMAAGGGKIYKVNENSTKVQFGPVPQMPPDIAKFGDECERDIDSTATQTEIEATSMPGQMRSGSAIRQMNEERLMPLTIPAYCTVRTVRDVGRIALGIGKLYYGKERLMKYLGEDNEWIVESFNGMDLVNDIEIIGNPSVADTLSSQRAEMLEAVNMGAFNPQFPRWTQKLILSGMHFNTSDEFVKQELQAKRSQEREIQEIIADPTKYAQGYPVMDWEDHEIEAAACIAFMYTPEFRNLDPMTQGIINQHWKQHMAFIERAQMAQAQMAAAIKGTPGQKGTASQPA